MGFFDVPTSDFTRNIARYLNKFSICICGSVSLSNVDLSKILPSFLLTWQSDEGVIYSDYKMLLIISDIALHSMKIKLIMCPVLNIPHLKKSTFSVGMAACIQALSPTRALIIYSDLTSDNGFFFRTYLHLPPPCFDKCLSIEPI